MTRHPSFPSGMLSVNIVIIHRKKARPGIRSEIFVISLRTYLNLYVLQRARNLHPFPSRENTHVRDITSGSRESSYRLDLLQYYSSISAFQYWISVLMVENVTPYPIFQVVSDACVEETSPVKESSCIVRYDFFFVDKV